MDLRNAKLSLICLALAGALAACDRARSPVVVCNSDLRMTLSPVDTSIAVGQSFRAQMVLKTCSGTKVVPESYLYSSQDSTIAQVDTAGMVTGRRTGTTSIHIQAVQVGLRADVTVVVR